MDAAIDRVEGRIARLQSDAVHAFDPAYVPRDPRSAARDGRPSAQAGPRAPLPCAAPEGAFLVFDDAGGRRRYERQAVLALRDGAIVDGEGLPLLGRPPGTPDGTVGALRIPRRDAALERVIALRVESDGRVAYARRLIGGAEGEGMQWVPVGRIVLAKLDAGVAHLAPPGERGMPPLPASSMQGGRVDLPRALERLQEAYLQLDALRAAREARDSGERTALGVVK
ncbi:MAG TPA: hypothetical protein VNJ51_05185 [Candidatus Dormibacteraeota bacterium]|nr:hypothetical protein [Candidatus Dormibacteraeota bacterium]